MQEKINELIQGFTYDNPRKVACFNESVDSEFYDLIRDLHSGILPHDFIFDKVCESLEALRDYDVNSDNDFYNVDHEIIESLTPIYTSELNDHYRSFSEYAEQASTELGSETVADAIQGGAYLHCQEILNAVYEYVKN